MVKKSIYNNLIGDILYNSKTSAQIKFDEIHKTIYLNNELERLTENELQILKCNGFFVDDEIDEVRDVIQELNKTESEFLHLTIFPNITCNFKCKYCYEEKSQNRINKNQFDYLLDKIYELDNIKKVYISWFGGEPSLSINNILYFMKKLNDFGKKNNIIIQAGMTTNFYLLDFKTFKELLNVGISFFQITLDGDKNIHDFYRPLINGNSSFDTVYNNLLNAHKSNEEFKILIRTNYDNCSDYTNFAQKVSVFSDDERFSFELHPICNWDNITREYVCKADTIHLREKQLIDLFRKYNIVTQNEKNITHYQYCYACMKNNYIIDERFHVRKCTVHLNDETNDLGVFVSFNDINDEKWVNFKYPDCPSCSFFPICLGKMCRFKKTKDFEECRNEKVRECEMMFYGK